jgi:hypothetical protein
MKRPVLGLAVATAAFAVSSLYLWAQLSDERERAAQVEQTTRELQARIAELEKASAPFVAGSFGSFGPRPPSPATQESKAAGSEPAAQPVTVPFDAPTQSPAFQKMMRTQIRASARRQYADIGDELGLGKEKARKLVELLAEQQASMFDLSNQSADAAGAIANFEQKQREHDQAIADLLGPVKAEEFEEYQRTLPVRMELQSLAQQLEDNGTPLSESQRKQLIEVILQEQGRVPMPAYADGMDQAEQFKAANSWKDDYDTRVAERASHILNAEQLGTYNDIQQMHKEMRDQFAASGMAVGVKVGGGAVNIQSHRVIGPADAVTWAVAAPAVVPSESGQKKEQKEP